MVNGYEVEVWWSLIGIRPCNRTIMNFKGVAIKSQCTMNKVWNGIIIWIGGNEMYVKLKFFSNSLSVQSIPLFVCQSNYN